VNERRTVVGRVDWPLCVPPTVERDRRACKSESLLNGRVHIYYRQCQTVRCEITFYKAEKFGGSTALLSAVCNRSV